MSTGAGGGKAEGGAPSAMGAPGDAKGRVEEASMFKQLNDNVATASLTLGNTLQEVRAAGT